VPDLPEQSRASREGHEPRPESDEVPIERAAVETSPTERGLTGSPSGNGSGTRLGDPVTDADPLDDGTGGTATGPGSGTEPNGSASDVVDATIVDDEAAGTSTTDEDADGGDEGEPPAKERRARRSGWRSAVEWALVIGGALLVALVVRTFLVQAFWIPSASMEPTLHEGDRVLVNKLSYDLHDVHHGDVIVFERPDEQSDVPHPEDEIQDLIKRVIALPGDVIEARDGIVYINDEPLEESYLAPDTPTTDLPRQEIPEGEVFVMGDNRTNSHDSRRFGPVDESSIVGRAFLRIYPLDDIGGL
jgi:signal peptidase I